MATATLRNWGGSIALPIPKDLLSLVSLGAGSEVNVDVQAGRLVIEAARPRHTLAQLMKEHKALKLPHDPAWIDFEPLVSEKS